MADPWKDEKIVQLKVPPQVIADELIVPLLEINGEGDLDG